MARFCPTPRGAKFALTCAATVLLGAPLATREAGVRRVPTPQGQPAPQARSSPASAPAHPAGPMLASTPVSAAPSARSTPSAASAAGSAAKSSVPGRTVRQRRRHHRTPRHARPGFDPPLRIGLVRRFEGAAGLVVWAPAGAVLRDEAGVPVLWGPMEWRIFVKPAGVAVCDPDGVVYGPSAHLVATQAPDGSPCGLARPSEECFHGYRGRLEFSLARDSRASLTVVNIVRLETYLRGVIADEMLSSAPREALRAQAIAARTYALTDRYRFASRGYDLADTVASQMYGGTGAETAATDEAVRSTAGKVVTRGGRMVVTDYCDDCGGTSAPVRLATGSVGCVVDTPADGGPDYCARGTHHTWVLRVAPQTMSARVGSRFGVGDVRDIQVLGTDVSGRVARVGIVAARGTREMDGERFRGLFGYRKMRSTRFAVWREPQGSFLFSGRGFGHGHGLCQWGAMGLADVPYERSCREILAHYYPGTRLADLRDVAPRWLARR